MLKSGAVNHIVEILYLTMFSLKQFISVTFFLSNKTNFPPFNKTPHTSNVEASNVGAPVCNKIVSGDNEI